MISSVLSSVIALAALVVVDAPRPEPVTIQGHGPVKYLAAKNGLTLYVYDGDAAGVDCVGDCLKAWPPLLAQADDKPVGDWKPVTRQGGALQWAYKGRPVYTYGSETTPGEASGDELGRAWHALQFAVKPPDFAMPPAAQLRLAGGSYVVTDYRGMTLYVFSRDGRTPACKGECLEVWPPLRAPALAASTGDWAPVDRPDGIRQWAYHGKLVYSYSEDQSPGDARGLDADGIWKRLALPPESTRGPVAQKTVAATGAARPGT